MTRSATRADVLDLSRWINALFWFAAGAALPLAVIWSLSDGDPRRLLRVGSTNPLRPAIEAELRWLPPTDSIGHDGQLYYAIARDPLGRRGVPEAIDGFDENGARYRYRRILFPALAGGFGQLDARTALWGMVLVAVAASGIASLALAHIASVHRLSGAPVLVALANPGALVSALLLTGDTLALALSLAGLALLLNARVTAAALALALAALAKETYLLVTVAAGAWVWTTGRARQALGVIATAALPLAAWDLWLRLTINAKAQAVENLSWLPLAGIVRSVPVWLAERNPVEIALLAVALVSLTLGVFEVLRSRTRTLLRYALAPWVVLALFAGFAVWSKPNNAARALAFLWPVAVLLAFDRPRSRHIDNPGPRG